MQTVYIKTPLGTTKIIGDATGISCIIILDFEKELSTEISKYLQLTLSELNGCFNSNRTDFAFKIKPHGTYFQKKVRQELRNIPFRKTIS